MLKAVATARPAYIAIMAIAFLLLGMSWAYATPAASAADDDFHLPSIWCAWGPSETCQLETNGAALLVPERVARSNCHVFGPVDDAGCVASLTESLVPTGRYNVDSYPPVFYGAMRIFVGTNSYASIIVMRFVNVLLALLMLSLAALVSLPPERRALLLGTTFMLVPVGLYFIASTNPSSWVIIGIGTFWAFLLAAVQREWHQWQAKVAVAGALLSAVMAVGARFDSIVLLGISVVAVIALAWPIVTSRFRRHPRLGLGVLGVVVGLGALALALGAANRLLAGLSRLTFPGGDAARDQPNAIVKALAELPSFLTSLVGAQEPTWVQREAPADVVSVGYTTPAYFYGVGSMEFALPAAVGAILVAVVGAAVVLGFVDGRLRKAVAFAVVVVGLVAYVLVSRATAGFTEWWSFTSFNAQPRYFYPLAALAVCVALIVVGLGRPLLGRGQAVVLGGGLIVAQGIALRGILARYVHGPDHSWTQLAGEPGWWWPAGPSPDLIWLIGSLAAAVLYCVILARLGREVVH